MKKSLLFPLLLALLFCQAIFSQDIREMEKFIQDAMASRNVPGAAVSIVKEGKIIFSKGFGIQSANGKDKVDQNTIFPLASVSKSFTAAAVGVQVDAKKVDWDDNLSTYIPFFALKDPYPAQKATPRDLLAHRTGLPAFRGDLLGKIGYSPEEIVKRIRFMDLESFRNKALYSNVGYFLAGQLIAHASGKSWEEVCKESLFKPLQMDRSGFDQDLKKANAASGHALIDGKLKVIPWDSSGKFGPAGGISSTAADLANWMAMLLNKGSFNGKQILKEETIGEMFAPSMAGEVSFTEAPPIYKDSSFCFGLGWDTYNYLGHYVVEKAGALDGVRTCVTLVPGLNIGIAILSNLNMTMLPEAIRAKFLELTIGSNGKDMQKEIDELEKSLAGIFKIDQKLEKQLPMGHALEEYEGEFENDLYGIFNIVRQGNELSIEAGPAKYPGKLIHWSNDTFILQWPAIDAGQQLASFTFGPENKAVQLETETFGSFKRRSGK